MTGQQHAIDLATRGANRMLEALLILDMEGVWYGLVSLGRATGARGNNDKLARPVQSLVRRGLVDRTGPHTDRHGAYGFALSASGRESVACIRERMFRSAEMRAAR
jgi:hypothetical protein